MAHESGEAFLYTFTNGGDFGQDNLEKVREILEHGMVDASLIIGDIHNPERRAEVLMEHELTEAEVEKLRNEQIYTHLGQFSIAV